jgi:hypothetical protein
MLGRHRQAIALVLSAAAVTVAVLIPSAHAFAGVTEARSLPAQLVGRWTRTVSKADVKRTQGYGIAAGTICTLTVKKNGVAHLATSTVGAFDGSVVSAGSDRVHILLGLSDPNVYRWHVSGNVLTFTKLRDTVGDREAVMEGVWKRK